MSSISATSMAAPASGFITACSMPRPAPPFIASVSKAIRCCRMVSAGNRGRRICRAAAITPSLSMTAAICLSAWAPRAMPAPPSRRRARNRSAEAMPRPDRRRRYLAFCRRPAPTRAFADGTQVATGIRFMTAMDWSPRAGLYGIMHGRDGTHAAFPEIVSATDDDAISDEMHHVVNGTDFGWPYSYYDGARNIRLLAPDYGGDGKTVARRQLFDTRCHASSRCAPRPSLMMFYQGTAISRAEWRGGAFIALHGTSGPQLPARTQRLHGRLPAVRPLRQARRVEDFRRRFCRARRPPTRIAARRHTAPWDWRSRRMARFMWRIPTRDASGASVMAIKAGPPASPARSPRF